MANLLTPLLQDQDLTSSFFNTAVDNMRSVVYQTADASVTNSVLYQFSTDLVLPVVGEAIYVVESCLFYDSPAAADIKFSFQLPLLFATSLMTPWSSGTAISATTNSINQQGSAANAVAAFEMFCGGVSSGTVMCIRPTGWIRIDTASGTLSLGFAQNTATAALTILKQGSWIALTRVA